MTRLPLHMVHEIAMDKIRYMIGTIAPVSRN